MLKHGTNKGWEAGCREECCTLARQRYKTQMRKITYKGGSSKKSTALVSEHIRRLNSEYGWTYSSISKESGVSERTLRFWATREVPTGNAKKVDKVLSLPLEKVTARNVKAAMVDESGTRRRLQAMAWRGFSSTWVARELGVCDSIIATIRANGSTKYKKVRATLAAKVKKLHDSTLLLEEPSGASADGVREHARQSGWLPYGVWHEIDDPECIPDSLLDPWVEESQAKLRTLYARGFSMKHVADYARMNHSNVIDIAQGRIESIREKTFDKILDAYDHFASMDDPQNAFAERNRTVAQERGWSKLVEYNYGNESREGAS